MSNRRDKPPPSFSVDSHELRCLSVQRPLVFMLALEQEIVFCATTMAKRCATNDGPATPSFELVFPWVAAPYRRLVHLCADRFSLSCTDISPEELAATPSPVLTTTSKDSSLRYKASSAVKSPCVIVHGEATLPLLRYADFLPGNLHPQEIFGTVSNVKLRKLSEPRQAAVPKPHLVPLLAQQTDAVGSATGPASVDDVDTEMPLSPTGNSADGLFPIPSAVFEASTIDFGSHYTVNDDNEKFDGLAFYLTIEQGLPLATHAHLLRFEVPSGVSAKIALGAFQRFSGWDTLDVRWDNDSSQRKGVFVFPAPGDASDILEKYESEETDDDADALGWSQHTPQTALPFRLRPVAPCAHVPYLEDAQMRRLRAQHWSKVIDAWKHNERSRNRIVILNIHITATLDELLKPFAKDAIVEAALTVDRTPQKRRRVFITFDNAESTKTALDLDGQKIAAIPGRPVFRIQVAAPYFDAHRRGTVLSAFNRDRQATRSVSPQTGPALPPPTEATAGSNKKGDSKKQQPKSSPEGQQHDKDKGGARGGRGNKGPTPPPEPVDGGNTESTATTKKHQPATSSSSVPKPKSKTEPPKHADPSASSTAEPPAQQQQQQGSQPAIPAPRSSPPVQPADKSGNSHSAAHNNDAAANVEPSQRRVVTGSATTGSDSTQQRAAASKLNTSAPSFIPKSLTSPLLGAQPPPPPAADSGQQAPQAGQQPPPPPPYGGGGNQQPPPPPPPYGGGPALPPPSYGGGGHHHHQHPHHHHHHQLHANAPPFYSGGPPPPPAYSPQPSPVMNAPPPPYQPSPLTGPAPPPYGMGSNSSSGLMMPPPSASTDTLGGANTGSSEQQ